MNYEQVSHVTNTMVDELGEERIKGLALDNLDSFAKERGYVRVPQGLTLIERLKYPFIREDEAAKLESQGLQAWAARAEFRPMTPEEDRQS